MNNNFEKEVYYFIELVFNNIQSAKTKKNKKKAILTNLKVKSNGEKIIVFNKEKKYSYTLYTKQIQDFKFKQYLTKYIALIYIDNLTNYLNNKITFEELADIKAEAPPIVKKLLEQKNNISEQLILLRRYKQITDVQKYIDDLYNYKSTTAYTKYLIDRYKEFLYRYDIVRIDHFRAFDSYYKIPIDKSAKEGFYEEGPGEKFFDELFKYTNSSKFIVEDLGDIRKKTELLRDKYNFTRMKILQYTLNLDECCDEYNDIENMVIYPGNHDNNTIVGWYNSLSNYKKKNLEVFLRKNDCYDEKINVAIIRYCLKSVAKLMIVTVQDILGLDENSRINLPGHEYEDNWAFKLKDFDSLKSNIKVLN